MRIIDQTIIILYFFKFINLKFFIMNKKFLSAILFGALMVGSAGTFTSCKDYDDDIDSLQKQIDATNVTLGELQALIKSGAVITSVSSTNDGISIVLSDGKSYKLTNGKDGANGTDGKDGVDGKNAVAWTIGADGYWYEDGVKTAAYPFTKEITS